MILLPMSYIRFKEPLQLVGRGKNNHVPRDKYLSIKSANGVFDLGLIFVGAQDEADGRTVPVEKLAVFPVVEIEIQ